MDAFRLRDSVIHDYAEYVRSFVQIREPHRELKPSGSAGRHAW
jgi:hypothetical protein